MTDVPAEVTLTSSELWKMGEKVRILEEEVRLIRRKFLRQGVKVGPLGNPHVNDIQQIMKSVCGLLEELEMVSDTIEKLSGLVWHAETIKAKLGDHGIPYKATSRNWSPCGEPYRSSELDE